MNKSLLKLMLLPMLSLLSCSKDGNGDTPITDTDREVEIFFTSGVSAVMYLNSRGIIEESGLPQDSAVGICGVEFSGPAFDWNEWTTTTGLSDSLNNARYTVMHSGAGQLLKQDHHVILPTERKLKFYAYYPYTESIAFADNQAPTMPVRIAPTTDDTPDYMYASAEAGITNVPQNSKTVTVSLEFNHALARIDILASMEGEAFTEAPVLKSITITTTGNQTGTMDISTGTIAITQQSEGGEDNKIFTATPNKPILTTKELQAQFLFIPGDDAIQNIQITYTDENKQEVTKTIYDNNNLSDTDNINLKAGYTLPIHIKYTRTAKFSQTVNVWKENEEQTFEVKN